MGWIVNNPDWPSGEGEHLVWVDEDDTGRIPDPDTLALVRRFAICDTYGGGQRARIRLGKGVVVEALDCWTGPDALMSCLAVKVEDHLTGLSS